MYGLTFSTLPGSPAAGLPNWPGASSAAARLAGRLVAFQCARFDEPDATIGDAGAVCAVIDPGGLTTRSSPVRIELAGTWTRGQTIVDQRDWGGDLAHDPHGLAPAVVAVALAVEADRYAGLWLEAVSG
jgi:pyrimidine-specific ribonucleoside hydrolase